MSDHKQTVRLTRRNQNRGKDTGCTRLLLLLVFSLVLAIWGVVPLFRHQEKEVTGVLHHVTSLERQVAQWSDHLLGRGGNSSKGWGERLRGNQARITVELSAGQLETVTKMTEQGSGPVADPPQGLLSDQNSSGEVTSEEEAGSGQGNQAKSRTTGPTQDGDGYTPKVALLFLVREGIPHEGVWRAFLEKAAGLHLKRLVPGPPRRVTPEFVAKGPLHPPLPKFPEAAYPGYRLQHGVDLETLSSLLNDSNGSAWSTAQPGPLSLRKALKDKLVGGVRLGVVNPDDHSQVPQAGRRLRGSVPGGEQVEKLDQVVEGSDSSFPAVDPVVHLDYAGSMHWEHAHLVEEVKRLTAPEGGPEVYASQGLFSIYVHCSLESSFPKGSLFAGREIRDRVNTTNGYAQHVLVQAELALLQAALEDPTNQRFLLVSDQSIPIYPPEVLYAELMAEGQSKVDACPSGQVQDFRWRKSMATPSFGKHHWRKSSQWFALSREHATLVMADQHVEELFHRFCYSNGSRVCVSDEHFVPSLLASYGLDNETDCRGWSHYTDWKKGGWHPRSFTAEDLSQEFVQIMRGEPQFGCDMEGAKARARAMFYRNDENDVQDRQSTASEEEQHEAGEKSWSPMLEVLPSSVAMLPGVGDEKDPSGGGVRRTLLKGLQGGEIRGGLSRSRVYGPTATRVALEATDLHDQVKEAGMAVHAWFQSQGYKPMGADCTLLARKFSPEAANATLLMALSCGGLGLGSWCKG